MATGVSVHIGLNEVDPNHYVDEDGEPWRGELGGCENDATHMTGLASELGYIVQDTLLTEAATSSAVLQSIASAAGQLVSGDAFLLTYSGHGGQLPNVLAANDPETDDLDETWCLYDRELLDDELYTLFASFRPGVRIVVISDSCNSGTISRDPGAADEVLPKFIPQQVSNATRRKNAATYDQIRRDVPRRDVAKMMATVVLLSGCKDGQSSYDDGASGIFTSALLDAWHDPPARKSLATLYERAVAKMPKWLDQQPGFYIYSFEVGPALEI